MKKLLFTALLLLCAVTTWAGKAVSRPFTATQPDGTQLTFFLRGDEHFSWTATADGALLVQVDNAYYVAKTNTDGSLTATTLLAHNADKRTEAEQAAIDAQDTEAFFNHANATVTKARKASVAAGSPAYFPHMGSPKALVLLVQFTDTTFTLPNPKASFDYYLNGTPAPDGVTWQNSETLNYGSAIDYFKEMSYGQFTPQFDIYGPFTVSKGSAYYGADNGSTTDVNYRELITDACTAADSEVDFSQYDANGDGIVDLVYIIYAGYAESVTGNATDIWPKAGWSLFSTEYDGKKIRRFGLNNELGLYPEFFARVDPYINCIGLFVHEFSHTLGLPDLYSARVNGKYLDNQAMELWSVMDGGEYASNGYRPTAYNAWEREVLGWMKADTLTEATQIKDMATLEKNGKAYKIFNTDNHEYVLLQNVQRTGWNKYIYGHGLLAMRVNYNGETVNATDKPNMTQGSPRVTVLPADGLLLADTATTSAGLKEYRAQLAGDPYPGTSNVTQVDSWKMMDGTSLAKPLYNITETQTAPTATGVDVDRVISFDFLKDFTTGINQAIREATTDDDRIYSIDGRYMGRDTNALPKGIYIRGGKKLVIGN